MALLSLSSFAQKEKGWSYNKKTRIVSDKKTPLFKIYKDSVYHTQILVTDLNDSLLVCFIPMELRGVVPSTRKNPQGSVNCKVFIVSGPKSMYAEVEEKKTLMYYTRMICDNGMVANNKLDTVAVRRFVTRTGSPYTSKYVVYDEKTKTHSYPYNN